MPRIIAVFISLAFLPACVTAHFGHEVQSHDSPLALSCAPRSDVTTEQFKVVSCTLENKSDAWLDVKVESLEFLPSAVHTSSPREIKDFLAAYSYKAEQDEENARLLLGSLVVLGAGASLSADSKVARAGTLAMAGGAATALGRDEDERHAKAQSSGLDYSADHLLGDGIRVPPKMYTRKFVLLELAEGEKPPQSVRVCLEKPSAECLEIELTSTNGYGSRVW